MTSVHLKRVYISGPMRSQPDNGFAAFDEARDTLVAGGYIVTSPADHDRELGWDEHTHPDSVDLASTMAWDMDQVCRSDAIIMLRGWEQSLGAKAEIALARALNKPVLLYPHMTLLPAHDEWRGADWKLNVYEESLPQSWGGKVRSFDTGATRDTDEGKLDYEAFLSPLALRRYAEYLHSHRRQSDGTLRSGDNWQKGIPKDVYMKSGWRHFVAWWTNHRAGVDPSEDICGVLFNAFGYLHELVKHHPGITTESGGSGQDR